MKTLQMLGAVFAFATLAACQNEDIDRETAEQDLSVSAATDAQPKDHEARRGHHDPARFFARLDQDGDGRVLVSELPERARQHLGKADLDGDGAVTLAELTVAREKHPWPGKRDHEAPTPERMLAHFDTNQDGKLALTELPERMRERIQSSDANGDGILDAAEIGTHLAERKAHFERPD